MAGQTKPWSQWTTVERDLLWAIVYDPVLQHEKWENKARYFNQRVYEVLPQAPERTASAVYLQWKSMKDGQLRATSNTQGSPAPGGTQLAQSQMFKSTQSLAGVPEADPTSRDDNMSWPWQNDVDLEALFSEKEVQAWLKENAEPGS